MDDMDKLEAGPELDALVAEKVMGFVWYCDALDGEGRGINAGYPCLGEPGRDKRRATTEDMKRVEFDKALIPAEYSTDIAAAWEVVEKLKPLMLDLTNHDRHGRWHCVFFDRDGGSDGPFYELRGKHQEHSIADDAPLAISRAALKAVGA